ncbi:uncharacterized protein TNCV_3548871 [Trichonephila clavipes]|nr:uncharacterized protein TNCV_3548871 [Trichonephila clavipes]
MQYCKRRGDQNLSVRPDSRLKWRKAPAQDEIHEEKKEEISVGVIKDKYDLNPVFISKERIDFDEDEIQEEKPKFPKRKCKNLSRRTVAELQQKVNLKASSNMVLIPQHWSFRHEYSQNKSGIGELAWKLTYFYQARWYCEDTTNNARKSKDKEMSSS